MLVLFNTTGAFCLTWASCVRLKTKPRTCIYMADLHLLTIPHCWSIRLSRRTAQRRCELCGRIISRYCELTVKLLYKHVSRHQQRQRNIHWLYTEPLSRFGLSPISISSCHMNSPPRPQRGLCLVHPKEIERMLEGGRKAMYIFFLLLDGPLSFLAFWSGDRFFLLPTYDNSTTMGIGGVMSRWM